ncbi:acyltransferase family protein [Demequina sp. SYSU T00192]|uniref:Acyltransferase family protein n=1 Tax=Demequina litoralis TaxID=3051660 RepID=A0ABT8GBI0_9MICO|nr:acyltransferase family protein [Demequina sp. SYSU T00192]MDN4476506.1 acyltransferase family protein [Demequina sp. SYSU T00192]
MSVPGRTLVGRNTRKERRPSRPPGTLISTDTLTREAPRARQTRAVPRGRIAGLDGLRAIAVVLVVAYHLAPSWLPGGYVGVDVFFVLSGFLITTILLRERAERGRISLRRFWVHRARRLLPALAVVVAVGVAVVSAAAGVVLLGGGAVEGSLWGDLLVGAGAEVAAAATFTSNWATLLLGRSYAAASSPHLFENLWSLAVEEQFYLLWPLAVILIGAAGLAMRRAAWVAAMLAAASALAMAVLLPAGDPTRVYLGTDTHAFGLMIGAGLAFWWARDDAREAAAAQPARAVTLGAVGLVSLGAIAVLLPWDSAWAYRGGLVLASLAAAAVVHLVVAVPALGERLDTPLLRWVGDRSYGIYLWHWPVLVVAVTALDGGRVREASGPAVVITVVATVAAAAASYRWLEMPVRRMGLRRAARVLVGRLRRGDDARSGWRRRRAVAVVGAAGGVLALAGAGIALAPDRTGLEARLEEGARLAATLAAPPPTPSTPATIPAPGTPASSVLGLGGTPLPAQVPPPGALPERRPAPPVGSDVTVIGDSVALGAAPALAEALPGIAVDAEVGRQFWTGVDRVEQLARQGRLRDYVVVALGTNGAVPEEDMDRLIAAVEGRPVVLVTPYGDRSWMAASQRAVREAARAHPNAVVADWQRAVERRPDVLGSDGIHPDDDGSAVFARTVKRALAAAAAA